MIILLILLDIYVSFCESNHSCGEPFVSTKCVCGSSNYYGENMYITNCTNTDLNAADVLQYLPFETQVLIFMGNNVSSLPMNIFGTTHSYNEKLKIIDMSNNNIREIKGKTFHSVASVERLILNHNSILLSSQHPRIFSNFESLKQLHLTNSFLDNSSDDLATELHNVFINSSLIHLTKLHLEQNEIIDFKDRRIFCDLPSLMDLHLGNNRLTGIRFHIDCLKHLRFIDLESNKFSNLSLDNLHLFDSFPERNQEFSIDISNNPFMCSRYTCSVNDWLQRTKVTVRYKERLKCYNSSLHSSQFLMDNSCEPVRNSSWHTSPLNKIIFIFIVLFIIVLLTYAIIKYTYKNCISTPILTNKVQYTVIGKCEDKEVHV